MSFLFKNYQNIINKGLDPNYNIEKKTKTQSKFLQNTQSKTIFYPYPTKEWFNSVYSYNKSYIKSLIINDKVVNKLIYTYCNTLQDKIKILFKRRRDNKIRYSADKVYVNNIEVRHYNNKIVLNLLIFNKSKLLIEESIRNFITLIITEQNNNRKEMKYIAENELNLGKPIISNSKRKDSIEKISMSNTMWINEKENLSKNKASSSDIENRVFHTLKNDFFILDKWNISIVKNITNVIEHFMNLITYKYVNLIKTYDHLTELAKKNFKTKSDILNYSKSINFNKSRFNNMNLNWGNYGIISLLEKLYKKKTVMDVIELKGIHLSSGAFVSALALKLRNRKNSIVTILRKAILKMVKIPDLHTLITFDDNIEQVNKDNIVKTLKTQVVSGVRFEGAGRLTRRLTAERSVSKNRHAGPLKNVRSSFNTESSTMLRGYMKSNLEYNVINSKTKNGTFGLHCWVSSH